MRSNELHHQVEQEPDFAVRRQSGLLWPTVLLIMSSFFVLFSLAWMLPVEHNGGLFAAMLGAVLSASLIYGMLRLQNQRDLLLVSEFQNAMLASAARVQSRFCLICTRDGGIVYFDPGFQRLFPSAVKRTQSLDDLVLEETFPMELRQEVNQFLQAEKGGMMVIPLTTTEGTKKYVLHLDLLPKPKGYFLLRGREFIEKRTGEPAIQAAPAQPTTPAVESLPTTSLSGVQAWAAETSLPFYVADFNGYIVCVSPALQEKYGATSLDGRPFSDLIYRVGENGTADCPKKDFYGSAVMQQEGGNLNPVQMKHILLDGLGYIGFILESNKPISS